MRNTEKSAQPSPQPGPQARVRGGSQTSVRPWAWALPASLALALAACGGSGRSGDDDSVIQGRAAEDEDYPNLSRVPGEVPRPTPESLRKELIEGLAADRANARYTGELLTGTSAAPAAAAPPTSAGSQVEIIWETIRVLPEGEEGASEPADSTGETGDGAVESDDASEEVEINWDSERVAPSGRFAAAGASESAEAPILAPRPELLPELLAVVYFPQESSEVAGSERERLGEVVARYQERGGRLRLVGHAEAEGAGDPVAQRIADLGLSLERADAVATTLLDLGADKEELLVEAKADGPTDRGDQLAAGERNNRRVEIFLEN